MSAIVMVELTIQKYQQLVAIFGKMFFDEVAHKTIKIMLKIRYHSVVALRRFFGIRPLASNSTRIILQKKPIHPIHLLGDPAQVPWIVGFSSLILGQGACQMVSERLSKAQ